MDGQRIPHYTHHPDELGGLFADCCEPVELLCPTCGDQEVLNPAEPCADCRREADVLADAIEAGTLCASCHGKMIDTAGPGDERCYWECSECGRPRQAVR